MLLVVWPSRRLSLKPVRTLLFGTIATRKPLTELLRSRRHMESNVRNDSLKTLLMFANDKQLLGRAYQVNVNTLETVQEAVDTIVKEFNGRLDIFVANSGIAWEFGPMLDAEPVVDLYKKVMTPNIDGTFWCARAAGVHFRRQKREGTTIDGQKLENFTLGSFIATASMSGHIANVPQLQAAYNASKAAVIHLCRAS